jgi:hypothetical protein
MFLSHVFVYFGVSFVLPPVHLGKKLLQTSFGAGGVRLRSESWRWLLNLDFESLDTVFFILDNLFVSGEDWGVGDV